MDTLLKELRDRKNVRRIVTYCGTKQMQHFQINKKEKYICWQMFYLPTNGNKAQAIEHNSYLSLKAVVSIINSTSNKH